MTTIYNPVLQQGDTWGMQISLTYLVNESATNFALTGYSARSQLRRHADYDHVALEFDCTIPDPSGCLISMTAAPSATALVPAGAYAWDVKIYCVSGTASGSVYTVSKGQAAVSADVTR